MQPSLSRALLLIGVMPLALGACGSLLSESTTGAAGIAGAGIAGSVTRNAVVGAGIGIGVKSLADLGLQYAERRVHRTEQDNIAVAAGALAVGQVGTWSVEHDIPIEADEHGELVVARELGGSGFNCREIVFSVVKAIEDKPGSAQAGERAFYTATVCKDGEVWKWASAEPATERWGGLQ